MRCSGEDQGTRFVHDDVWVVLCVKSCAYATRIIWNLNQMMIHVQLFLIKDGFTHRQQPTRSI